mmetsp:Transcript_4151/g.7304  ORF Transcript_4151/g.7304 Transcript_4151/m.7304 type:complete len:81 (+) Transcript_4151:115-357(+)
MMTHHWQSPFSPTPGSTPTQQPLEQTIPLSDDVSSTTGTDCFSIFSHTPHYITTDSVISPITNNSGEQLLIMVPQHRKLE